MTRAPRVSGSVPMPMMCLRRAWPLLAALLLLAPSAAATTVLRQSLDSLTDMADIVVRGHVESVEGHAEVGGNPFRIARIRVDETIAGQAPARVNVRLPGGASLAGRPRVASGVPFLLPEDEVVLFLKRLPEETTKKTHKPAGGPLEDERGTVQPAKEPAPAEQWTIIALSVGTYDVERKGSKVMARRNAAAKGMAVSGPMPAGGMAPDVIKLDDLTSRVRTRAEQGKP